jgi:predicted dehydrogenase
MSVSKPVRGCLVGIGGYGRTYLKAFEELEEEGLARLAAAVVRNPAKYAEQIAELEERGVRCLTRYEDALDAGGFDFIVPCTPLQTHRPMVLQALEAGMPVLCEKSAAPTVQDCQAMAEAQARTGVPLDIAYPQQNASSVLATQRALIGGCIGRVQRVVVRGAWMRLERYYERSAWAGRVQMDGLWTLDGPVNNPLAHYIFVGMYLASSEAGRVASPATVRGELYRARPTIEGEDTAAIEATFDNGVSEYAYVTLAAGGEEYRSPRVDVIGEDGTLRWVTREGAEPVRGRRADGTEFEIAHAGQPGSTKRSVANFARYLLGESDTLYSPIGDSVRFARLSNGAFDSSGQVHQIAAEHVDRKTIPVDEYQFKKRSADETTLSYELRGICDAMTRAGDRPGLFSDVGVPWAVKTEPLDVTSYAEFPQAYEPRLLPWE